ncbi:phosphoglucosamine mutase [Lawsonella clevelandensis]|uniref:Phosphoglucosamine mutase n=1 Tax=Lawsonella clevelandensis TaxID=1528099 RepID=A0A5E3ZXH3_9ACTN|nr:phosphoglucosamine mutase [Lawsonella clevelandensis]ALE34432.1 phosphoglucosamine mutase [Lawsonella clevelandensis]MDU7193751.1 phosphoglucosamine mutase [Lawsonella clevelandensis]VHO00182.1 Phosphoglucosamine mutase [Lawsonella clevelandensis]
MARLFGTDGVRGLANDTLTPHLALQLGAAAAEVLAAHAVNGTGHPRVVLGRDPRISGEMLEAALAAGISSRGVDVDLLGVLPTPAVAFETAQRDAAFGVMISASHNPMPDNGIKFFAAGGHKLDDALEDEIEARLGSTHKTSPTGGDIGRINQAQTEAHEAYLEHLLSTRTHHLSGLTVVVDAANGAASYAAPEAYERAGATVIALHNEPNGLNINDNCGSTHMESLRDAVLSHGADLGLAHDGDADRCLAIDAEGNLVDGDQIMAIMAIAMKERGELADDTLVATVMSNLGLHLAMKEEGINLRCTAVGDRYVLEDLRAGDYSLGGEQSGHIVLPAYATTGDGVLTGLQLMDRMAATGQSLAELASVVTVLPQVLINVAVSDRDAVASDPAVVAATLAAEHDLGETGRVLLRASGTEQLVRVMVEAATEEQAQQVAGRLAEIVGSV